MVLFKSIKQESISFLSEDLKKDWMFHKVKTGEKDGYGSLTKKMMILRIPKLRSYPPPLLSLSKEMKQRIDSLPVEFSEKTRRNQHQHI
ncbi:hypothetical protein CWI61_10980 [Neisseria meningitidis]|nr:hypothetical protein CWI61_10980 [Neisseria meningitidis]